MNSQGSVAQLRPAIADCLRSYARRKHTLALLRATGQAVAIAIVWLIVWGVIDRFVVTIPSGGRLFLLFVLLLWEGRILRLPLSRFFSGDANWLAIASEIEAHDPRFRESLLTVVSENLALPRHRASAEMTSELAAAVELNIQNASCAATPPDRQARLAATTAAVGLAVFISLFFWPRLGLQELVARQMLPMANLAPVKTTRISLLPGSVNRHLGEQLTIIATVEQLRGSTVILQTSSDNRNWSAVGMTPSGNGTYTHTLTSITRDLTYYVSAGDASSEKSTVQVLRAPLVKDFRIRLQYPKYVAREPLTLTNTDGTIQAPADTVATVILTATEPLMSASFTVDGQVLEGKPTGDPHSREVSFEIKNEARWRVEMTSDRSAPGSGPGEMLIHAIPNRPPIAKLQTPPGALFLRPADEMRIGYQAADDYALGSLEARISVNNAAPIHVALLLAQDPQSASDTFPLKLSDYSVALGDLVTVKIAASDRAGQTMQSDPLLILAAAQTVTVEQRYRLASLSQAVQFATAVDRNLSALQPGTEGLKDADSTISSACESAALLVQSLLFAQRGVDDEPLAKLLAVLADAAATQSARLEQLNARLGGAGIPADWLESQRQRARTLQSSLHLLWEGVYANTIAAEQAGLDAAHPQTNGSLERLREDIRFALHELGIDAQSKPVPDELSARVAAARDLMNAIEPIDFTRLAAAWADSKDPANELLAERFTIAAHSQSVRIGGNLDLVRDLETAARAVRSVENRSVDARPGVAQAIADVMREHRAGISEIEPLAPDSERYQIRAAAQAARVVLSGWAGERQLFSSTRPGASGNLPGTRQVSAATQESDTREQMLSAIRQAQEELADLPLQLGRVEQSVQLGRQSQNAARQAELDAQAAPAATRAVARRAADAARMQSNETFDALAKIEQQIDVNEIRAMTRSLQSFGPDASSAAEAIGGGLEPALARLRERTDGRDPEGIEQAIIDTRTALALSQDELRRARLAILDKDPLVAARWFFRQTSSTSRPAATQPQNESLAGLGLAWDDSLRRAAEARLAAPSTQPSPAVGLFEPGNSLRPWLDSDVTAAGTREDDPPQFKEAIRTYFKVLGRPDADIEP